MRKKSGLTALYVHKTTRVGKHHDGGGHGLYLCVSDTGAKRWEQRITVGGRRRTLGLGRYCDVPLEAACQKAMRNWLLADEGVDPLAQKTANRPVPTFAEAAEEVIAIRRDDCVKGNISRKGTRIYHVPVGPRTRRPASTRRRGSGGSAPRATRARRGGGGRSGERRPLPTLGAVARHCLRSFSSFSAASRPLKARWSPAPRARGKGRPGRIHPGTRRNEPGPASVPAGQSFSSMPASFRIAFAVCRDRIFVGTDTAVFPLLQMT